MAWYEQVEREITEMIAGSAVEQNQLWETGEKAEGAIARVEEGFLGIQYAPHYPNGVWQGNRQEWLEGSLKAARSVAARGGAAWVIDQISVLPRSPEEAAVSYRVTHWNTGAESWSARALFLETWVKHEGHWYLRRHTAEKNRYPA